MDNRTDPVIQDLLKWLKDNLPPDADEESIFKNVRRVQKVFDTLIGLSFGEFYNHAISTYHKEVHKNNPANSDVSTLEESVDEKLKEIKDYVILNEEKQTKTQKLEALRSNLHLKKEQYQLLTSIKLDSSMDLISRYNHLISKK